MGYRAGIDLGGTKLAVGIVDYSGEILGECASRDHIGLPEEDILDRAVRNLDSALDGASSRLGRKLGRKDLHGVGILFPGHLRWPDGVTLTCSNLPGFKSFPLRRRLEERLSVPVLADNDANGQTLGEHRYGAGIGVDHMVFMTVSTGVGGGIIIDGKLYRGMTGTAGEFGHMIVDASGGGKCACGNRGCLMGSASGLALPEAARRAARRLAASGKPGNLPSGCVDVDEFDGELLGAGCGEDNELCREIVDDFARYIGIGLYNIFQILNPRLVVLGGGLLNLPGRFFEGAVRTCNELAGDMMLERMEIRKGSLGSRAGILGAASLFEP